MSKIIVRKPIITDAEWSNEPFGSADTVVEPQYEVYELDNSGKYAMPETDGNYVRGRDFLMEMAGIKATK